MAASSEHPVLQAHLSLRAHTNAPARVELEFNPSGPRIFKAVALWIACWAAIPFLLWVPPHYPWVLAAFLAGPFLCHRTWTGRYTIRSFAGLCPRCGSPLALGVDRTVDLPHTLTCFRCHFEPLLEVHFVQPGRSSETGTLRHQRPHCTGRWSTLWLADEPYVFCEACFAGLPATAETTAAAGRENEMGDLLGDLADEGWPFA